MDLHKSFITLTDNGVTYTLPAQLLYDNGRHHVWTNPYTGNALPPELIEDIINMCCPSLYVSHITKTNSLDNTNDIGRLVIDSILQQNMDINKNIVHIDTEDELTFSFYNQDFAKKAYTLDVEHFLIAQERFTTEHERRIALTNLLNYMTTLNSMTNEEIALYNEIYLALNPSAPTTTKGVVKIINNIPYIPYVPYVAAAPEQEFQPIFETQQQVQQPRNTPQTTRIQQIIQPVPHIQSIQEIHPIRQQPISQQVQPRIQQSVQPKIQQPISQQTQQVRPIRW